MKKKIIGLVLGMLICVGFCSCGSKKATKGLEFTLEDGTYIVTGYTGEDVNVVIPDTHNDIPVTVIAEDCFEESEIQTIDIGKNIEIIEDGAFAYSTVLKEIHIPKSVKIIGDQDHEGGTGVFRGCINLKMATFEKNSELERMGASTFDRCENLSKIEIPESVTYIGRHAFAYCVSIESIDISENVSYVGSGAFMDFTNEQTINVFGSTEGWENRTYSNFGVTLEFRWDASCEAIINYK